MEDIHNQQNQIPIGISPPSSGGLNPQFGVWALSPERDLEDIEHRLNGDVAEYSQDNEIIWIKGRREPVMNEQGIYEIMAFLRGITSKIVSLSNSTNDQYYRDLLQNCLTVNEFLYLNYRRFNLAPTKYELAYTEVQNFIQYSFAKARDSTMIEFVHPKHRSVENIITQRQMTSQGGGKGGGWLSFLGF